MKFNYPIFALFLLMTIDSFSQSKMICVTVDDLPVVAYGIDDADFRRQVTTNLIKTFDTYRIPAIGYVNEKQLYKGDQLDSGKVELLVQWVKNGYELGNHTFSHSDYNNSSENLFFADVKKGEKITRALMKEYGKELRYFRHPYLHTGPNEQKCQALNAFLTDHGYQTAPVTIDNDDYIFAKAYHNAYQENDIDLMAAIGSEYVNYMEQKLHFFEQRSADVFGRNIVQTLLIHANLLNSEYFDELAVMYRKNGYTFVSQEEALKDEAYSTPVTFYTEYGISWIFRWGLSKGMSNKELRSGDIEVPQQVVEVFNR